MLLTTTPGAAEFSIVISAPRPPNALGWPVEVGTATTGTSVIAPIIVASEASRPATTTRQSTSPSSVPSASRRADPAAADVVDPDDLGAGHPGDEGGLRGDRGVAAAGAEHADAAHRLGHRADGGGHRGGVHGRVRVVLAGQRDEGLGGGAQHQRRAVGVLAARLAHQGEDLLGAAAGAPDDVGLDGGGGHRGGQRLGRVGHRAQQRLGGAAGAERRVGARSGAERNRRIVGAVVQRGRLHVRDSSGRVRRSAGEAPADGGGPNRASSGLPPAPASGSRRTAGRRGRGRCAWRRRARRRRRRTACAGRRRGRPRRCRR